MAGTGKKWAIGCGAGCGVLLLIMALVIGGGIFAGKRIKERAEGIDASFATVKSSFGAPEDYVPPLDGRIPADRLETFLAVRADLEPTRALMAADFRILDGEEGSFFDKFRAGMRFVPELFDFIEDRNRALVDRGMGLGEYQYIYALAYYALLHRDPADGPGFTLVDDEDEGEKDRGWTFERNFGSDDEEKVRERRTREVRRMVNRFQRLVTANQLEALDAGSPDLGGLDPDAWRARLAAEAESLESERLKLLWEDGLPDQVRDSLLPFQAELEGSYDPMTSVLEMGMVDHD